MSASHFSRLRRYAGFSVLHGVLVVLYFAGVFGIYGGFLVLAASLPLLWAWGAYQADVGMNASLTETERQRWRIALWLLPWSMASYFHRHVRERETA